MNITVIGSGYVGVVSAACFCEFGFNVCIVDTDKQRLEMIKNGDIVFNELGLNQMLQKHETNECLSFTDDLRTAIGLSDVVVITVSTTKANEPVSDLSNLHQVTQQVALALNKDHYTAVIIKTSVPVGTCTIIADNFGFTRPDLVPGEQYDIVANPGFLREGAAIYDFMTPSRVLIGFNSHSAKAKGVIEMLYSSIIALKIPFIYSNFETVELIRLASIGFIVTKMAFINEIADLCSRTGADISALLRGIALDQKIGNKALEVSPGFGGVSYPKAARVLLKTANSLGIDLKIVSGAIESNCERIAKIKDKIISLICDEPTNISFKQIAILGLSFKPLTDDIRESASIFVINDLLESKAKVNLYDPLFKPQSKTIQKIPENILKNENFLITESIYEAVNQSDIAVIMTHWPEFRASNLKKIQELMNKKKNAKPIILDYRNMFTKSEMAGFEYIFQGH
ncbi:MAG: nucleotide sugar dehydrogenase [Holosporales bacterium]|jgi:UDPglucose 6-dehydrogenase|nr:nucleotide sugar dehydrogenase [Holosporales bacterium]